MVLAVMHTLQVPMLYSVVIVSMLTFLAVFVIVRVIIRVIDLVGF